jgi:MFS family permease
MKASRARYGVIAFAISLAVLSYIQRVAISQAAGPISHDLHLNQAQMGFVFGAFGLSYALFELPAGLLGDRLGVRRVLSQIVLAWSIFTALTGAAWDITSLWVVRFLFGAGEAGCFPNLTRMLSVWLPARERVSAQSLMWACTRWGGAATPPLVLAGVALFGWRWTFVTLATLGIAWFAIFLLWFRDDPLQHPSVNVLERKMLAESRIFIREDAGRSNWLSLLLTLEVFVLILQYFCFSFVWYFYITWWPTYLRETRAQSPARAAAFATLPPFFGGFGSIATGLVATRLPGRVIAFLGFLGSAILLFAFTRIRAVLPAMSVHGTREFLQWPDHADILECLRGNRWSLYCDGRSRDEHDGQFCRLCRAGSGRLHSAADRRRLESADLVNDRRGYGFSSILGFISIPRKPSASAAQNVDESLAQISADNLEP